MQKLDYIVVGLGIAGISFCEQLLANGKKFKVYNLAKNPATKIAGGVVNPVVLKRINPVWKAEEFLAEALPFYQALSKKLNSNFLQETEILRIFNSTEEQNDWIVASDKPSLSKFLSPKIIKNLNKNLKAPLGFGKVANSLFIDTEKLLAAYSEYLLSNEKLIQEKFDYKRLKRKGDAFCYGDAIADKIVFCEGSAVVKNPFFNPAFIIPKKGEYITIEAPDLQVTSILKGSFFIIPLGKDRYKVGATFAHGDASSDISEKGKKQLISFLEKSINCSFQVIDQEAGFRPTVKDRKPLLGNLAEKNSYCFNGLGTRGLLMAPLLSKWLYGFCSSGRSLPNEVDVKRFEN